MHFGWDNGNLISFFINLAVLLVAYGFIFYILFRVVNRKVAFYFFAVCAVVSILSLVFDLLPTLVFANILCSAGLVISLFSNLGDFRQFLAKPFHRNVAKPTNFGIEKIYDRDQLYKDVRDTVIALSNSKTGALLTFERNTSLKDIIKNGVKMNATVTPELLQTIFYVGTRLHDGAVVIHGNQIIAASVFFLPTTQPYAGKYGSRHRAAIGISEVSDAVTVVVSEETGRISFAVNGQLEAVDQSSFLNVFENYMSSDFEE